MKCYKVKFKELINISDKACKIKFYDGSEDIFPYSQIPKIIDDNTAWISEWILERKNAQYSRRHPVIFTKKGDMLPYVEVITHIPEEIKTFDIQTDESLKR